MPELWAPLTLDGFGVVVSVFVIFVRETADERRERVVGGGSTGLSAEEAATRKGHVLKMHLDRLLRTGVVARGKTGVVRLGDADGMRVRDCVVSNPGGATYPVYCGLMSCLQ